MAEALRCPRSEMNLWSTNFHRPGRHSCLNCGEQLTAAPADSLEARFTKPSVAAEINHSPAGRIVDQQG